MDSAMTDLARRAVACGGWRWMAGMLAICPSGLCGEHEKRLIEDAGALFNADHLPDLTDPATIGCLTALVIERISWGRWVIEYDGSIQPGTLVAALEAANA